METRITSFYTTCLLVFIAALTSWVCVGAPVEGSPDMRILHKHVGDTVHVPCNWVDNAKTARWQYRNDSVLGAEFRPVATHFIREDSTVWSESYFDGKADVENLTLIVGSFRAEMVGQYRCVIDGDADNTRITALRLALPPVDNTTTDNPPNVVTPIIVVIAILLLIVVIALLVWKRNELIEWWNTRRSPVNHIAVPPGDTDPATRQSLRPPPLYSQQSSSSADNEEEMAKLVFDCINGLNVTGPKEKEIIQIRILVEKVYQFVPSDPPPFSHIDPAAGGGDFCYGVQPTDDKQNEHSDDRVEQNPEETEAKAAGRDDTSRPLENRFLTL